MRLSPELQSLTICLARSAGLEPSATRANRSAPAAADIDWDHWLELAHDAGVAPFLGAHRQGLARAAAPAEVCDELYRTYRSVGYAALFRCGVLAQLAESLGGDPEVVALKGTAVGPTLYGEAAQRTMADVDLLFASRAARARGAQVLTRLGYRSLRAQSSERHDWPLRSGPHKLTFDLHENLATPPLPAPVMREIWHSREPHPNLPSGLQVLDAPSRLIHCCIHALQDPTDSPLLRSLLEIAWMSDRLSEGEREAVVARSNRWNITERVARALGLASDLFAIPSLLPRPSIGAYELWCRTSLEWPKETATWTEGFLRHVSDHHCRLLAEGASPRDPRPLLRILAASAQSSTAVRVRAVLARFNRRLARAPMREHDVGDALLLRSEESGDVHLLAGPPALAYRQTRDGQTRTQATARLERKGIARDIADQALDELIDRRIIQYV